MGRILCNDFGASELGTALRWQIGVSYPKDAHLLSNAMIVKGSTIEI
jgi:hypothetical protein